MLQYGVDHAHWQSAEQLHLTARYIGNTDRHQAEALVDMLDRESFPAIEAQLAAMGCFTRKNHIDQIWAGVTPKEPFVALHQRCERIVTGLGFAPEHRSYVPHITLARLGKKARGAADYVARHADLSSAPFIFDQLVLYESHLGKSGSHYAPLASWPLS
ncbi:RNA 2',3'-cyclic phosphodiesterase [Alterisphingorhabdus coralli]|uniref:RNA 2',3'-cyclic phosphodiesterase n=1 Tax=Alterisphingorhabdus coralli TaxID=3071408 RepID=A0AA97F799_9SPHN|nr:RNA 2',3'-cyclic phosphodiesterase [Parasphingorhabdus sp. SCSIO 66989]WOE75719.1 RNA 2',3'-cyclic phosphodiesterase [Parasphingorhabdus sp. SCSIO 66989]